MKDKEGGRGRTRRSRWTRPLVAIVLAIGLVALAPTAALAAPSTGAEIDAAELVNFINPDPLNGDDGMPLSPSAQTGLGGINLVMDVDGNAVEATRENDLRYFGGSYYLYGTSQACGSFDYSPASIDMTPVTNSKPAALYRYCGITIYQSDDLMNWKLVSRTFPTDPATGKVYAVKKPRVVYSAATDSYVMWVHDKGSDDGSSGIKVMTGPSPVGPWSPPFEPINTISVTASEIYPDFSINTGPDGETYMVTSHATFSGAAGVNIWKLTPELTGVADKRTVGTVIDSDDDGTVKGGDLFGGIGLSYHEGKWYVTGTRGCGNCVATQFSYIMSTGEDPMGTWASPDDMSTVEPLHPTHLSRFSANAQPVGATMLPDGEGGTQVLVTSARYRSSPTGAPGPLWSQSGDDNFALAGLFLTPLIFADSGRISVDFDASSHTVPLATPAQTQVPDPYQAALVVDSSSSATQTWSIPAGDSVASVSASMFQRTPDRSPGGNKPIQEPMVNQPLHAKLTLSNGLTYDWTIDAGQVSWSPHMIPLNLPKAVAGPLTATLTLATTATNGAYGIAVGPNRLPQSEFAVNRDGSSTAYPNSGMYLTTSETSATAPVITRQPLSVIVQQGATTAFTVDTAGSGIGLQWKHDGVDIPSPNGMRESNAPSMRFENVQPADSGTYTVEVSNTVGAVTSVPVTLEVIPPTQLTVSVDPEGDHVAGDPVIFTATQTVPTALSDYRWAIQKAGESDFTPVDGQIGPTYAVSLDESYDGAQIKAQLLLGQNVFAESPALSLVVAAAPEPPVTTTLTISSAADSYALSQRAEFSVTQSPETGLDDYAWFIKRAVDKNYSPLAADGSRAQLVVSEQDAGAQIIARLYDATGAVVAESTPYTLRLAASAPGTPDSTSPTDPGATGESAPTSGPGRLSQTGSSVLPAVLVMLALMVSGGALVVRRTRMR